MAITYPLSLPTARGPSAVTMTMVNVTALSSSPFTGQQQVYRHQGQWWKADLTLDIMSRPQTDTWASFLAKLSGRYGTFLLGDPAGVAPKGTVSSCVVNGSGQTGYELAVTMTGSLLAGDYIQLGSGLTSRLYKVLTDQTGSGTLDIWPKLRESPVHLDPVTYTAAVGLFRLDSSEQSWQWSVPTIGSVQITAIEAI